MKYLFLALFFIGHVSVIQSQSENKTSEVIIKDSLSITFLKTKKTSKKGNARSRVKVKGKESKRILTRCKIKALYKQPVDINAFSLLDTVNKLRYRINEYIGYKGFSIMGSGYTNKMYLKTEMLDKKGKPYVGIPKFDATITDSFADFVFEGYTNIEVPLNFGSNRSLSAAELFDKKKYIISTVYYAPTKMDEFTSEIFFIVHNTFPETHLQLYYGNQFISEVETD